MDDLYSTFAKVLLELTVMMLFDVIARLLLGLIFPPVAVNKLLEWNDRDDLDQWDDTDDLWFGVSSIFHVFMDPLFMYVPLINEKTKCVMLDDGLKIAAIVLRSFGDVRYLVRIIYRIKDGKRKSHSLKKIAMIVANDTLCILPVPQVVTLIVLPKLRGSRSWKIMKFFNILILLQYWTRLYPIYKLYKKVNKEALTVLKKNSKEMPEEKNSKEMPEDEEHRQHPTYNPRRLGITINIVGYILASHVLGAFWYFFSIQREIACWGFACQIENGCEFSTSCVENTFKNITHIKNLCPVNPPNATVFDFGIFLYALQSGMQGSTNFSEKVLQCFSWGLRNLSSFASNLNSSTYGWENLFVIVISISGLILFMYLLGHSQETDRRDSIKRKMKMIIKPKIQSLLSEYGLSSEMEWYIKRVVKLILEKDEDFILENMFSILSFNFPDERRGYKEFLDSLIKRELFLGKLKKVDGLRDKDEDVLKKICEHLELMIYTEGSYIIRQGEPLDMMFFVTQGTVLTYTTNDERNIKVIEKEKDSLYGEELLTLAKWTSSKLSSLPISTVSVKSHKKVEVFALNAADLQKVVSEFPGHFNTSHMEIVSAQ